MKTRFRFYLVLVAILATFSTGYAVSISGPATICPNTWNNYNVTGLALNCSVTNWTANNTNVLVSPSGSSCAVNSSDIGSPGSFLLTATAVCTSGTGTKEDPYQYATTQYQMTVSVSGVGVVTMTSSISSFTCNPTASTFTVTASAANANYYNWSISGGTFASVSHTNTATVNRAGCSNTITVTCNAKRSECSTYPGQWGSKTISMTGATLPTVISGPSDLCESGPGSSATYSVSAGPNSCWTYNWYFSPATVTIAISNPNIANPVLTVAPGALDGIKHLRCTITACGQTTTLLKDIRICNSASTPTNIQANQQGNTCYYQFDAIGGCGSTYQWQVNGGTIQSTSLPRLLLIEPGYYTVKVRVVNGCGTSGWYTETFNLPNIDHDPPCMWKTSPTNDPSMAPQTAAAAVDEDWVFNIFPNPASGRQDVEVSCSPELIGGAMELYNISGAKVLRTEVGQAEFRFSTEALESGLYFCRLTKGNVTVVRKLVIAE